ncbi:proline-specific peptidase [Fomitopsis serialis]|uniref:proline-specific peptidase n=1 Tax=Fomitopsis serialis TaxID=139415 RepID=UPI002007A385|nr:proline-specific peptidase [Neoantrodia serialis]KAH9929399.1 proline-specific peptidase [Neoantrodia serialis]
MAERTGTIPFTYEQDTYQTWYKVVGNLTSGVRPIITLHGGPGFSHHYLLPFVELTKSSGIPVIFYDQIGIGGSSHPADKPKEFWTVDLFMDELDNLLSHFGIGDNFDLFGHSWGGMLALHYASHRHPTGLKHIVAASATPSMELWVEGVYKLREQLPPDVLAVLKQHEAAGTTDSKEYQDAIMVFYKKHLCTLNPWPKELLQSFAAMEEDPTVYTTMNGPSEMCVNGTLRTWSCVDQLHTIRSPTLLTNGRMDEAHDASVAPIFNKVNRVKWIQFANSSHVAFLEEPQRYFSTVSDFLLDK